MEDTIGKAYFAVQLFWQGTVQTVESWLNVSCFGPIYPTETFDSLTLSPKIFGPHWSCMYF